MPFVVNAEFPMLFLYVFRSDGFQERSLVSCFDLYLDIRQKLLYSELSHSIRAEYMCENAVNRNLAKKPPSDAPLKKNIKCSGFMHGGRA